MKRCSGLLALLVLCAQVALAQPTTQNLMGSGMPAQLSTYLNETATLRSNNVAVKMLDAAGTPIPVLKINSSDDTILDAASGDIVKIAVAQTPEVEFISDTMTFTGNTGVIAAPTAVAFGVGAVTELTVGNDLATFSGNGAAVAAPTAVAFNVGGTTGAVSVSKTGISFSGAGVGVRLPSYVPTLASTPAAGTNDIKPNTVNVIPTHAADLAALLPPTPIVGDTFVIKNASGANERIKAGGAATMNGVTAGGYVVMATGSVLNCAATAADNYDCWIPVQPTPAGP